MAKDLNKVQLTGHLGATPDGRYTQDGRFVCSFRVASGRQWKDSGGAKREETEWFRVTAWEKLGEICNQYLDKGTHVYVEGRLQTRKYTDRDGIERYATEVVAQDMIILSSRGERGADAPDVPAAGDDEIFPDVPPQARPAPSQGPARVGAGPRRTGPTPAPRNQPQPIDDDDVPF